LPPGASISVLRYEKQLLDQQIAKYQGRLKAGELESLQSRGRALERQADDISAKLSKGGVSAQKGLICFLIMVSRFIKLHLYGKCSYYVVGMQQSTDRVNVKRL